MNPTICRAHLPVGKGLNCVPVWTVEITSIRDIISNMSLRGSRPRVWPDPRDKPILVDAHFLDEHIELGERAAVDRLIEYHDAGEISLIVPHTVWAEWDHPNTPEFVRRRRSDFIYTLDTDSVANAYGLIMLMRGNALPGKHEADGRHLTVAAMWSGYFTTLDRRMLNRRDTILEYGVIVATPSELVSRLEGLS